jgi:hypothetical protein
MVRVRYRGICECQELVHVVGTGLVHCVVWVLLLCLLHHHYFPLHLRLLLLLLLPWDALVVASVVGGMVVDWHFLGYGIASVGWRYSEVHWGGSV